MQPQGKIGDLPGGSNRCIAGARVALAQLRRHYLLDQVGVPVGRGLHRAQVPGLHPVLAERGHRPDDRERFRAVLPAHSADQAVVLEFGQFLIVDSRRLEQLAPGHVSRRARGAAAWSRGTSQSPGVAGTVGGAVGEPFPDHLQREVRVPLHGEDIAQPVDVLR